MLSLFRHVALASIFPAWLVCQVPATDSRVTETPNTNKHFSAPQYASLRDWQHRREYLRRQVMSAAGLLPMPARTPLHPRIFGRIERDGYTIEKVLLETLPGYYLGGNLYRPSARGKHPGVLSPHGHWKRGRLEHQELCSVPGRCINLARQGYVVFTYDMVGYNDTKQTPHVFGGKAEQLWGFGPLGLQLWNSVRAVDFVEALDDVDRRKLAATGASGGGTQTFLLTAVDDRIGYSAPVNMISAIMQGGSPCENAPNLRLDTFNVEIAALMAPRPMLMVSATGDWTRNTPREEFPAIERIYALYGKADHVETVQIDAAHNYNQASREAVYRFFGKHILGVTNAGELAEKPFEVERDADLLALEGGEKPKGAITYEQLFAYWKESAQGQMERLGDRKLLRECLMRALAAEWPGNVAHEAQQDSIVLTRAGRQDRVAGIRIEGAGKPALVVHPQGAAAARQMEAVKTLIEQRRPVLLIDAFQTGPTPAPRDESARHFLAFNRTADANRVQDILTALAFLDRQRAGEVDLLGEGDARIWCLFAAAIAPVRVRLATPADDFRGTDEEFITRFFVPGIQRAGGLQAALRLVAR